MCEAEHHTEPAGEFLQLVDCLDEIVGRADDRCAATFCAAFRDLVEQIPRVLDVGGAWATQNTHVVLIVPTMQTVHRFSPGLFLRLGDVPAHQHSPVASIDSGAVDCGGFFGECPLCRQRLQTFRTRRGDGKHTDAVLAGNLHPAGADARSGSHRHALLDRQDLQRGLVQREPVAVVAEPLLAVQQPDDDTHCLVLPIAQKHRADAHGACIAGQRARPAAEHRPALGHVVELHDSLGHVERMVVGQRHHAGAELDRVGDLTGSRQEHLRRRDHLPSTRVMLTAPELVVAQVVEVRGKLEIALELQRRALAEGMVWCKERAEPKTR